MAFAVPGDLSTCTGGYLYDRRLAEALRGLGHDLRILTLGGSFPHPTPYDMADALAQLTALPQHCPVLVDGLAYGALDSAALARVSAPMVALVHHPLALEPGLTPPQVRSMAGREAANLALARHILVTSPHIARLLQSEYGVVRDRISVAQPGFDRPAIMRVTRETPPRILSVGLLARRKGHDLLLHALAAIADLDWQADIVGRAHEPETAQALQDLCVDLGLGERVHLLGEVPQARLDTLYRRASLFALATRYEGYGIVFGEAMGYGLPIVSTRAGAVPDTVAADAGLLVPPEDVTAFATALRRLLSDPELYRACEAGAYRAAAGLTGWKDAARVAAAALFHETEPRGT